MQLLPRQLPVVLDDDVGARRLPQIRREERERMHATDEPAARLSRVVACEHELAQHQLAKIVVALQRQALRDDLVARWRRRVADESRDGALDRRIQSSSEESVSSRSFAIFFAIFFAGIVAVIVDLLVQLLLLLRVHALLVALRTRRSATSVREGVRVEFLVNLETRLARTPVSVSSLETVLAG